MENFNVGDCFFDSRDNIIYYVENISLHGVQAVYLIIHPFNIYITHIIINKVEGLKPIDPNIYLKACKLLSINSRVCRTILENSKEENSGPAICYLGGLPYIHIQKIGIPGFRLDISSTFITGYEGNIYSANSRRCINQETYDKIENLCLETSNKINNLIKDLK